MTSRPLPIPTPRWRPSPAPASRKATACRIASAAGHEADASGRDARPLPGRSSPPAPGPGRGSLTCSARAVGCRCRPRRRRRRPGRRGPGPPASANPPAHTSAARTPAAAASASAPAVADAGTHSTARSTGAPVASTAAATLRCSPARRVGPTVVDQHHRPRKRLQRPGHGRPELARGRRRTDHRDPARLEQRLQPRPAFIFDTRPSKMNAGPPRTRRSRAERRCAAVMRCSDGRRRRRPRFGHGFGRTDQVGPAGQDQRRGLGGAAAPSSTRSAGVLRTIRASSHSRTLVTGDPPLTATTVAPAATPASSSAMAPGRPASSSGAVSHSPQSAPATGAVARPAERHDLVAAAAHRAAHRSPAAARDRHDPPVHLAAAQRSAAWPAGERRSGSPTSWTRRPRSGGRVRPACRAGWPGRRSGRRTGRRRDGRGSGRSAPTTTGSARPHPGSWPPAGGGPSRRLRGRRRDRRRASVSALGEGGGVLQGHLRAGPDREVGGVGGVAQDHHVALTATGRSGASGSCPTGSC